MKSWINRSMFIITILINIAPPISAQNITQPRDCTISCCINCKVGINCKVCYNLSKGDTMACPCMEDLSPWQRAALEDGAAFFKKPDKNLNKSSPLKSEIRFVTVVISLTFNLFLFQVFCQEEEDKHFTIFKNIVHCYAMKIHLLNCPFIFT